MNNRDNDYVDETDNSTVEMEHQMEMEMVLKAVEDCMSETGMTFEEVLSAVLGTDGKESQSVISGRVSRFQQSILNSRPSKSVSGSVG